VNVQIALNQIQLHVPSAVYDISIHIYRVIEAAFQYLSFIGHRSGKQDIKLIGSHRYIVVKGAQRPHGQAVA
jgi:hypothetical protein